MEGVYEMKDDDIEKNDYKIKLDVFEGPFDLLLHLIEKQKVEITDIPISLIADQYIDYLYSFQTLDLEIASEFLVMASTLLHLKSKRLLPKLEVLEEEVTEEELVRRLVEYRKYKEVASTLAEMQNKWDGAFYSGAEKIVFPKREEILDLNIMEILDCYRKIKLRYKASRNDNSASMKHILEVEKVSMKDKMKEIIWHLASNTKAVFSELFNVKSKSRMEVITGFIAILELNKNRQIRITQKDIFGEIYIHKGQDIEIEKDFEEEYL